MRLPCLVRGCRDLVGTRRRFVRGCRASCAIAASSWVASVDSAAGAVSSAAAHELAAAPPESLPMAHPARSVYDISQ
ncbi:MAG TPA: hypothetical protein VF756_23965 [Thermoanaerobaculia bacterium]